MMLRPVAPMRKAPQQERAAFTVHAVLEAASALVEEEGADQLAMSTLARRAGVSPGTLYQYFPDRGSVLTAVMARLCEELLENFRALGVASASQSLESFISTLASAAAQQELARRGLKRAVRRDFLKLAAEGGLVDASEDYAQVMASALRSKLAVSEPALNALCRQLVWTADGLLEGVLRHDEPVDSRDMARWLETVWTALLQGVPRTAVDSLAKVP